MLDSFFLNLVQFPVGCNSAPPDWRYRKKRKKARAVAEENKDGSKSITSFDRPQEIKYSELEEYPQNDFNPEIIERRENNEIDSFKADESS